MRRYAVVAIYAVSFLVDASARADVLVMDIAGHVVSNIADPAYVGAVGPGDPFHVSLVYDTSTAPSGPFYLYYGAPTNVADFSLGTIQGTSVTPTISYMWVQDFAGHSQNLLEILVDLPSSLNPIATGLSELQLDFWNTGVDNLFPGGALPTSLNLADFTFAGGSYKGQDDQSGGGVNLTIDSISIGPLAVPEPSTFVLFATGASLLSILPRLRRRRTVG